MELKWKWKTFDDLTIQELYAIIQLRERVFVVGQNCPYLDCDGRDEKAWHLLGYADGKLVAYLRAFKSNGSAGEPASFGRVLTAPEARGRGYGRQLVREGLDRILRELHESTVRISAMAYLKDFYSEFGFIGSGEGFEVEGIPHLPMTFMVGTTHGKIGRSDPPIHHP